MTTPQTPSTVLRGSAQLLAGVPYLLNYRPERSLVIMGMMTDRAARERRTIRAPMSMLLRVDLPPLDLVPELVAQLAGPVARLVRDRGSGLVDPLAVLHLFIYDADDELAQAVVGACQTRFESVGADVNDALLVRDGRYRSLVPVECPPGCDVEGHDRPLDWVPEPEAAAVPGVADLVLEGRNPAQRRSDVVARVRRRDERAAGITRVALGVLDLDPARPDRVAALRALGHAVSMGEAVAPRDRAAIVRTLEDRWVRDLVLARWLPEMFPLAGIELTAEDRALMEALPALPDHVLETAVGRLLELSAAVPVPSTAPLLTLAGCLAWSHGEGTVANEVVAMALEADPAYRMAQLVSDALEHGMSPRTMRRAAGDAARAIAAAQEGAATTREAHGAGPEAA